MKKWKLIMAAIGAGLLGGVLTACNTEPKEARPVKIFQQDKTPNETGSSEPESNKNPGNIGPENTGIQVINPKILESLESENNGTENSETESQTVELIALADTEEQAQEIATLYQIEFLSFSNGVAVYTTDQEPSALIALGQQNGYPALSVNNKLEFH